MTTRQISNSDDVIDSRDVIARIAELESLRDDFQDEHELEDSSIGSEAWAEWDESDEGTELSNLQSLANEAEGYAQDWKYGEQLIRDSYFVEFAQELAEDCGMVNDNATWPNTCIDWDEAARQLQEDYTSVEFGDITYWIS